MRPSLKLWLGVAIAACALLAIALAVVGSRFDEARLQRQNVAFEYDELEQEAETLRTERDELQQERDALRSQVDEQQQTIEQMKNGSDQSQGQPADAGAAAPAAP